MKDVGWEKYGDLQPCFADANLCYPEALNKFRLYGFPRFPIPDVPM